METIEIVAASGPVHLEDVRRLWRDYWTEFGFDGRFQQFADELAALPGKYAPPRGRILVAVADGETAGCVAFRPLDQESCEAKRLYVHPRHRGRGIARRLMEALLDAARDAGYRRVCGDTMPSMADALAFYERLGVRRRGPYSEHPTPGALYLEQIFTCDQPAHHQ